MTLTSATLRRPRGSVAQMVARKQVRMHLRKIREREYCKLKGLIPSVASKKSATKLQVVEEAVRYIEELHVALLERFRAKHGDLAEDKAQETLQTFVQRVMGEQRPAQQHARPAPTRSVVPPLGVRHGSNNYARDQRQPSFFLRKVRPS